MGRSNVPEFVHQYKRDVGRAMTADYVRHKASYPGLDRNNVLYRLNTMME